MTRFAWRAKRPILLLYGLLCALFLGLCLPFWIRQPLYEWDLIGHYFSAQYFQDHLLPFPYGWNPLFFAGYPEGQLYPSLFHYVTALLAFVLGAEAGFKILVMVSLLLAPLSFYYFCRSFRMGELEAALAMVILWSSLVAAPWLIGYEMLGRSVEAMGGDLYSTLRVGLVTHAFALPWVFFFMGALVRGFDAGAYLWSSILLALAVLSHLLSGLVAVLFFTCYTLARMAGSPLGPWRAMKSALRIGALSFLLSAYWAVPFVVKLDHASAYALPLNALHKILLVAGVGAVAWPFQRRHPVLRELVGPILFFFLVLTNFIIYGDRRAWNLHFYRLHVFILLLSVFFIVLLMNRKWLILAAACTLVPAAALQTRFFSDAPFQEMTLPQVPHRTGRTHVLTGEGDQPSARTLQTLYPWKTGNSATYGLFVTSSINSPFVENLIFRPIEGFPQFQNDSDPARSDYQKRVEARCRLLGVDAVLTSYRLEGYLGSHLLRGKKYLFSFQPTSPLVFLEDRNVREGKLDYFLYELPPAALVEPVRMPLRAVADRWPEAYDAWFKQFGLENYLLVKAAEIPAGFASDRDQITDLKVSSRMDHIRFQVQASRPIPVLVKCSYYPNWKARAEGRSIPIYRVAPSLMLVFARGDVELKYTTTWDEVLGLLLSGGAVLLVFSRQLSVFSKKRRTDN